jgi:N-hydroxyarylamine O-acetyltransferase
MTPSIDLESYFKRIGYSGDLSPTLQTLSTIHYLHTQSIPFENLNPLLRIPVMLDLDNIQQKLVKDGRGGYCFEHNLLLKNVLESIGFKVKGLAARVVWNIPPVVVTARGHMLLQVQVDGEQYIADVGFGGLTLTQPLKLEANTEQSTSHEPFRLLAEGEEFILQAKLRDEWKPLYKFSLHEHFLPDYEVTSWYLSNNPNSHFVTGLIAAKPTPQGRYALRNNELAIHHLHGETERYTIKDPAELKQKLQKMFGIALPNKPQLDITLKKIAEQ